MNFRIIGHLLVIIFSALARAGSTAAGLTASHSSWWSCQELLGSSKSADPLLSGAAERFLQLIRVAVQPGTALDPQFRSSLSFAAQAAFPVNPFLSLTSYQGKAFSLQTEALIGSIDLSEWGEIRNRIQTILGDQEQESAQREADAEQTSGLPEFGYLSFEEIFESLKSGSGSDNWMGRADYLGQTSSGHYIVSIQNRQGESCGIAAISGDLGIDGRPILTWMTRKILEKYPSSFLSLSTEQQALAKSSGSGRVWVVNGRLYMVRDLVVQKGSVTSQALVELDPQTGQVINRFTFPQVGGVRFLNLANRQIAVVQLIPTSGNHIVKEVFQLDQKSGDLLKTGIDLSPFKMASVTVGQLGSAYYIEGGGMEYRFDLRQLYQRQPYENGKDYPYWVSHLPWSITESIRPESQTFGSHSYGRMYIRTSFVPIPTDEPVAIPPQSSAQDRLLVLEGGDSITGEPNITVTMGRDHNLLRLGDINWKIGHIWWVDRRNLKSHKIPTPEAQVQTLESEFGSPFEWWEINKNSDGEHLLVGFNPIAAKTVAWTFNPTTLRFEDPKFGVLPENDRRIEKVFLSSDQRQVIGRTTDLGLWFWMNRRLSREGKR